MNITGGQAVVEFLKRNDITEVFGMAGHGNLALLDSFIDTCDFILLGIINNSIILISLYSFMIFIKFI